MSQCPCPEDPARKQLQDAKPSVFAKIKEEVCKHRGNAMILCSLLASYVGECLMGYNALIAPGDAAPGNFFTVVFYLGISAACCLKGVARFVYAHPEDPSPDQSYRRHQGPRSNDQKTSPAIITAQSRTTCLWRVRGSQNHRGQRYCLGRPTRPVRQSVDSAVDRDWLVRGPPLPAGGQ